MNRTIIFPRFAKSATAVTMAVLLCLAQRSVAQSNGAQNNGAQSNPAQSATQWRAHDRSRPLPTVIDAGTASTQKQVGRPSSDAIVLFDGKDLSQWCDKNGNPSKWKVENGEMVVAPHTGDIFTRRPLGDMQLHVEFNEPVPAVGKDQDRGNSGVILMGSMRSRCWTHTIT